ncbi:MAG: TraB/GumN family protein [Pseudomonadota bacterium]|nr:TraB/GumN family protein [Pseudomonadota bacterium]
MRTRVCLALSLLLTSVPAPAQSQPGDAQGTQVAPPAVAEPARVAATEGQTAVVDLETVVVSGAQPGPGLWKVSRDGRTLYILGTLSPLPRRMEWMSGEVESVIARAQAVISPPSVTVDSGVGVVRGMLLLPSLFKARRNPDGRSLQQTVPPELYARWLPLKTRYLGRNNGVEAWRPIFAAQELYEAAMKRSGLSQANPVTPLVRKAAKRHGITPTPANARLVIQDPKSVIREFNSSTLADIECFSRTLSRIETDLEAMRARANAWAVGDIDALRALPYDDQYSACVRAVTETGLARRVGASDLRLRVRDAWFTAAEDALARHEVSFATLPIAELLKPDGYLAQLRAKGYEIEAP